MEVNNKITVLGSLNGDIVLKVKKMPKQGETISSSEITKSSGGKGSNQAGACAKLGANTTFLWQVGKDEIATMVLGELKDAGVDVSHVKALDGINSGQAYILLMPDGENSIIIHGGANMAWSEDLKELDTDFTNQIKTSKILLLQREIPEHINIIAAKIAKESGVTVILDAGGMDIPISKELLETVNIFSPNETELERIMDSSFDKDLTSEENALKLIEGFPLLSMLLKLGSKGSVFISNEDHQCIYSPAVTNHKSRNIIDTIGAGDCYTAAFATKLAEGLSIKEWMDYANTAAFLCITKYGALPSMPTVQDVNDFINEQ